MKKRIFSVLAVFLLVVSVCPTFADRDTSTIKAYTSTTLIKRGDWKVYRITYVATANGGTFSLYDATSGLGTSVSTIKTEGSEATSLNGKPMDFTVKPLEGSTGLYLYINNATVVIEYE